ILMAEEKIIMPQLGESVTEGTINTWLVKEGDFVNEYDPLVEVMTDKVNAEVPSSFTGTIKEIVENEGSTVKVGNLLGYIETEEHDAAAHAADNIASQHRAKPENKEVANDQAKAGRY